MWGVIQLELELVLKYNNLATLSYLGKGELVQGQSCQVTGESMSLGKYEVLGVRMDWQ